MSREVPRRRRVLKLAGGLIGGAGLAGCSSQGETGTTITSTPVPGSEQLRTQIGMSYPDYEFADELRVLQWFDYWKEGMGTEFENAFGVSVEATTYTSNEELLGILETEGLDAYDVAFPSDWAVTQLIETDSIQPLDLGKFSNWENLGQRWIDDAPYDTGQQRYSVPHIWGTTGYAWNREVIDRTDLTSWDALWNPEFAGLIQMMDLPREIFCAALQRLGYSASTTDRAEIMEAKETLIQQKDLVDSYVTGEMAGRIADGAGSPIHAFSGAALAAEALLRRRRDEETTSSPIEYQVPEEGGTVWIDTGVVTAEAPHPNTAHLFLDYLLSAQVGAAITNYTLYPTPNEAAKAHLDEAILSDPAIYPSDQAMESLEFLENVGDARQYYEQAWTDIQNA